ncbi:MAG: hypothetical protein MUC77_07790 [Chromatiaceae bacterium]|jgi:hypothetical protein|nr:hypothetical protein [Chromatiaceae bacterium]
MRTSDEPTGQIDSPPVPFSAVGRPRVRLDLAQRRPYLDATFALLAGALAAPADSAAAERLHRELRERTIPIRGDRVVAAAPDYARLLARLTALFAPGCEQREDLSYAFAAPAYAALIEAMSTARPGLDYRAALGQLLELMAQLFGARQPLWKLVYRHLRAVPASVGAKQTLRQVCAADIREWYDAGVQNLFQLQTDLSERIAELGRSARALERRAARATRALERLREPCNNRVVSLQARLRERELADLRTRREALLAEQAGRADTLALIESDIREFEGLLRSARRAYYLRPA